MLARVFSQFFFVPAPLLGRKKSLCWHQQRYKTQNALESAKEDGAVFVRTPPSSRAFPSSSSSRFLLICSLPSSRARAGESFRKQTEREGRPFVFQQLVFFCFSLSLSLLCRSLSFSLSLCLRAMLLRCSRLVTKQHSYLSSPSSSLTQNKKSKSASRARM